MPELVRESIHCSPPDWQPGVLTALVEAMATAIGRKRINEWNRHDNMLHAPRNNLNKDLI